MGSQKVCVLRLWHPYLSGWHRFLWVRSLMSGVPDVHLPPESAVGILFQTYPRHAFPKLAECLAKTNMWEHTVCFCLILSWGLLFACWNYQEGYSKRRSELLDTTKISMLEAIFIRFTRRKYHLPSPACKTWSSALAHWNMFLLHLHYITISVSLIYFKELGIN